MQTACNYCWFLTANGKRTRAMLPNDDSKYLDLSKCDDCKAEDERLRGLYLNAWTRRQSLPAPATVRGDR